MKTVTIKSAAVRGVEAHGVDVTVSVEGGRGFSVAGLPEAAAKESGVRVRCAIQSLGVSLDGRKVSVTVSPAVGRDAASLDLPIAVGVLTAVGYLPEPTIPDVFLGELGLTGELRRVSGVLPVALWMERLAAPALVLPSESAGEAASIDKVRALGAGSLRDVVSFLRGESSLPVATMYPTTRKADPVGIDFDEIRGMETVKRALEIAAAGGHPILFIGSPGSGKSMFARALVRILPEMTSKEAREVSAVYSTAGKLDGRALLTSRPFRAPHHDVSVAGLVGGGPVTRPGEVSLAHQGVLFLDELPEFKRAAAEALREPMEGGSVRLFRARDSDSVSFPAAFHLVAAMQPCPCGYAGSSLRTCECSGDVVRRYQGRLVPAADRFGLHVDVPDVDYKTFRESAEGESSAAVRERVTAARGGQAKRGAGLNASYGLRKLAEHCKLNERTKAHLDACVQRFGYSGSVVSQVLRVARTIADLAGAECIGPSHITEALCFREMERVAAG